MSEGPDSPFAEFAAPKLSAVDVLRFRREEERRQRRALLVLLARAAVGCFVGAAGAAFFLPLSLIDALLFPLAGTACGALAGLAGGAIAWGLVSMFTASGPRPPTRGTPQGADGKLAVFFRVWGVAGICLGAALGTLAAALPAEVDRDIASAVSLAGSVVGLVLALVYSALRSASRPTTYNDNSPGREARQA